MSTQTKWAQQACILWLWKEKAKTSVGCGEPKYGGASLELGPYSGLGALGFPQSVSPSAGVPTVVCDESGHTKFPFSSLAHVTLLTLAQAHLSLCSGCLTFAHPNDHFW